MTMKNCMQCGLPMEPGQEFCANCGLRTSTAAAPPQDTTAVPFPQQPSFPQQEVPPPFQTPPIYPPAYWPQGASPQASGASTTGMGGFLGKLLVMSIPLLGLILAIVWSASNTPGERRAFARAMIVFVLLWSGIVAVLLYLLYAALSEVVDISFHFIF